MLVSERVKKILDGYESDNPETKTNLARILMQGDQALRLLDTIIRIYKGEL